MMNLKTISIAILLLVLINACMQIAQTDKLDLPKSIIDEVQKMLVPDKRDNIYTVEAVLSGNKLVVKGETTHPKVQQLIDSLMKLNQLAYIDSVQLLPNSTVADNPQAIIRLSVANLRKKASLGSELISQTLMGQKVQLLKKEGSWYLVKAFDGYFGWVYHYSLSLKSEKEMTEWDASPKIIVTSTYGHVFSEESENSAVVCDIVIGDQLKLIDKNKKFYHVDLADGREGFIPFDKAEEYELWFSKINATPEHIVKTAKQFLGVPYMWGGTSAKFLDCSGFTQTVYKLNGIQLQRDASQQVIMGVEIDTTNHFANMQLGDLLFFGRKATENSKEKATHVAIYIGDTEFIHEAGLVKINSLDSSRENYSAYRKGAFLRVKRILE